MSWFPIAVYGVVFLVAGVAIYLCVRGEWIGKLVDYTTDTALHPFEEDPDHDQLCARCGEHRSWHPPDEPQAAT